MSNNKEQITNNKRVLSALLLSFILCSLFFASEASADIVVFKNGRTMSARGVTVSAGMATLALRDGGQVTFPADIIARVDQDEVPYPAETEPGTGSREPGAGGAEPASSALPLVSDEQLAARPFAELISSVAAAHDVDVRLIHAVIEQESNYRPRAQSKKGARGLMQLMPATARHYGVRNSYDPKSNLEAGVRHLKDLLKRLELPVALAAYNAGEGTIQRYGGLPPFPETQTYVRNILRRLGRSTGN
jgi:hypothetical protein